MHYYLKEYFDYLYNGYFGDSVFVKPYDVFIDHLVIHYYDITTVNKIIVDKFPHINTLYDLYVDSKVDGSGVMSKLNFVGTYFILEKYVGELTIILRKEKLNRLKNGR